MRIIGINKNIIAVIILLPLLFFIPACGQKGGLQQPNDYARQSQEYYRLAVAQYEDLIRQGKDADRLYFQLGHLYYSHGDYESAIGPFKKSSDIRAKKFLAISYYRLGNLTDALEVFNKTEIPDDEYLYYHGLACEKLNLFDQALNIYQKIKDVGFKDKAVTRVDNIEKKVMARHIKYLSPETYKILLSAPAAAKYPQAGALILHCDEKIEITSEGTKTAYLHYIIKILNERGKEDFSETEIGYDSTDEKVELEYARTIKPDGTVAEVGTRHIRDVSKYMNFPLYSNARAYIVSFPEITQGSVIEYKIRIYCSQLINKKDFVLDYPLQASEPIIAANFGIGLPKDRPLHIKVLNEKYNNFGATPKPAVKEEGGRLVYSWQFKNIPQIIPEANMPPQSEINPTILISTFDSWQDIYNWWWKLAKDRIIADEAIKNKVRDLTRGLSSPQAKAMAIYNFCAKDIRYVAVEYGDAGYQPHKAADIFRNKYGDCKDQAVLLITMLKEVGIPAWPVLIATREDYNLNEDFPAVLFNHCIAAASLNNRILFLDPTAETCSFGDLPGGDQNRKVFICQDDGYSIQDTPLYPAGHNLIRQQIKIKVNNDGSILARKDVSSHGIYDQAQRFWLLYTPPELIGETLKEKIQGTSIGATLQGYNIDNLKDLNKPIVLSYSFKGPEYFTEAGSLRIMPQLADIESSLVAKDKRKYPIDFGILDEKEKYLEIEIPEGFVIKYMPANVNEDSPWLTLRVEYKRFGRGISFVQDIKLKKTGISENEYPEFKLFFDKVAKSIKQRLVLEKVD